MFRFVIVLIVCLVALFMCFTSNVSSSPALGVPSLASPANNIKNVNVDNLRLVCKSVKPPVRWHFSGYEKDVCTVTYSLQVATDDNFNSIIEQNMVTTYANNPELSISGLSPGTSYWWRYRASQGGEVSDWSEAWTFTTRSTPPVISGSPSSGQVGQDYDYTFTVTCCGTYCSSPAWSASGLPPGLMMSGGAIYGVPTVQGTFPIKISVSDVTGMSTSSFSIKISPSSSRPLVFSTVSIPGAISLLVDKKVGYDTIIIIVNNETRTFNNYDEAIKYLKDMENKTK